MRGYSKRVREGRGEKDLYLINEVSFMVNLSQKRIRDYEREGFIKPNRDKNTNNLLYSEFEVTQIRWGSLDLS
jgi:MerR HTH family regulatory protein